MPNLGICEGKYRDYKYHNGEIVKCYDYADVIHHKDRNRKNNNPSNLINLCKPCHAREHSGEYASKEPTIDCVREMAECRKGYRLNRGFSMGT